MSNFKLTLLLSFCSFFVLGQETSLVILGTAQDAGSPQIACQKSCCKSLWESGKKEGVVSLGLIDSMNQTHFLFEATPDITQQLQSLKTEVGPTSHLGGVFLTHAHMGHYSGLMFLGKEALGGDHIPVYTLPRMANYLKNNGPWEQLVEEKNIVLFPLVGSIPMQATPQLKVTPLVVPHRDEYSETAGYQIEGPNKIALFIPDIDKWEKWKFSLIDRISQVDYALIDATFFNGEELPNRDMSKIPHPFVIESMELLKKLPVAEKKKVYFIHFNHTNPLLKEDSEATKEVIKQGYNIARTGLKLVL